MNILNLEAIHQNSKNLFQKHNFKVQEISRALSEDELINQINQNQIQILGIRSKTNVTKKVLQSCPSLKIIGAYCIGTNQIDIEEANKQGVAIFNAPYSNGRSVVELAVGEIIMLVRRAAQKNIQMHASQWQKSAKGANEVRGKILGIVGYGTIGSQVSVLAEAIGMKVYFYDLEEKPALGNAIKCQSLGELLKVSDVVSLHVDGRKANQDLISKKEIQKMKDGAVLINLGRGSVVNLNDLKQALENEKLGGAGLDVFDKEPKANGEFETGFEKFENVILTPHIGGSTQEAQAAIGDFVPKQILNFVLEGNTSMCVNLPQITPPPKEKYHRFVHLHKNTPGVLAKINETISRAELNIEGQYLKTNQDLGFVITDCAPEFGDEVIQKLSKIEGAIFCRKLS